ncbi:hypothetical protein LWI28_006822 [Acer negundo]|uniref:Uncharacterized protein n=1 Tax=Acer negundo TaxID=4023 RepID=A0AAD5IQ98_ACENE|nr:hypothetical protein LWI28_006822 [Acer negundo]
MRVEVLRRLREEEKEREEAEEEKEERESLAAVELEERRPEDSELLKEEAIASGDCAVSDSFSAIRQRSTKNLIASKVLKETCSYIKRLHSEVDGLSERLSQLLNSMGITSVDDILQL